MTAVPPYRIKVPLLLGGPHAAECCRAQTLGFRRQGGERAARRRQRHQDVPQRDHQGPGGDGDRELHGRPALRRRGATCSRRCAKPSRHRLGEPGRLLLRAGRSPTAGDAPRRCARRPSPCARPDSSPGARPVRPSARPGWPTSPTRGCSATRAASDSSAAARTGAPGRPDPRPSQDHEGDPDVAATFEKTPGWLDWCARPSTPRFTPPPGAVDAHCHVFGPGAEFPYAPERKYTPCDASKAQLFALRDHLGFARNVIVQSTCHGADNRAMVDACRASGGRARGVATVRRGVTDRELARSARRRRARRALQLPQAPRRLHARATSWRRSPGASSHWAGTSWCTSRRATCRVLWDFFTGLPTTGRCRPHGPARRHESGSTVPSSGCSSISCAGTRTSGPRSAAPSACRSAARPRGTASAPPTATSSRSPAACVETFPDRVLWGTDWPHPNLKDHMPDDGLLVDFIPHIAPTPELQRKLLVDEPDASLLAGRTGRSDGARQALPQHPRDDDLRRRAVAQGLLAEPVLHEPDEGGEPRALQGERARLSRRVADDGGAETGCARARSEPRPSPRAATSISSPRSARPTARASCRWPRA